MSGAGKQTEVPPTPAGIAIPIRRLLLVLTGCGFLAAGTAVGILLERQISQSRNPAASTDNAHTADGHAVTSKSDHAAPGHGDTAHGPALDHSSTNSEHGHETAAAPHGENSLAAEVIAAHDSTPTLPEAMPGDQPESLTDPLTAEHHPDAEEHSPLPETAAAPALPAETVPPPVMMLHGSPQDETLARADQLFLEGSYRAARDKYLPLIAGSSGPHTLHLALKLALCEEMLGNSKAAQTAYRHILEHSTQQHVREAALLGQTRIWAATGRSELATAALFKALLEGLTSDRNSALPHQLACLVAGRVRTVPSGTPAHEVMFRDEALVPPELAVHPIQVMDCVSQVSTPNTDVKDRSPQSIRLSQRSGNQPDEIVLSLHIGRTSADAILKQVLTTCGLRCHLPESDRIQLAEHTLQPDCDDVPLSLILDAICEPFELMWASNDGEIAISSASNAKVEDLAAYRRNAALRVLRFASARAPEHADVAASCAELGRVIAVSGATASAIQTLERTCEQYPRSEYVPIVWYNLGKLLMKQGRPDDAAIAFYHAADMLAGASLEAASYLYVGRMCLENDNPRGAITPLTRAMSLATGTPYEPTAALQLSCAYLMLNHFQRANSVLMDHRSSLEAPGVSDQAAFLSTLVHYHAATEASDKFRAGSNLIGTMTNLNLRNCFGGHWTYLAGNAYRDTGMTQDAVQVYRRCIETSYPFPLQNRMRATLLHDAPELLSTLPSGKRALAAEQVPETFQIDALLTEANAAYHHGKYDDAVRLCRNILTSDRATQDRRRTALRLMGQVLQAQGHYEESVQCFTGTIPAEIPAPASPSAKQPKGVSR
ncbi:tetratricopeptide repeat protein [Planctomicrobium piriforme]|uniref:Tetratricopeptide repeat-containing protein n=1 Tax=Planctomicrobium piriforme TaxID=1576369 RepID=A0A1I3HNR2_9PLAN|nr:tetratricopeptide repeat protein [Planctomicrobium piriforme]SFI37150.1 Tetratricopeptide repeat-containing protein [Planctomicrobium piriforme]